MIAVDEDALICDFAETYHIYDYRSLPARTAATLAVGLRADARIMLKLSGSNVAPDTLLLAAILDALHVLAWQNTKDAAKGKNRPESLLAKLQAGAEPETESEYESMSSVEGFWAWRSSMIGE